MVFTLSSAMVGSNQPLRYLQEQAPKCGSQKAQSEMTHATTAPHDKSHCWA